MNKLLGLVKCFSKLHEYRHIFLRYQPFGLGSGMPKGWNVGVAFAGRQIFIFPKK